MINKKLKCTLLFLGLILSAPKSVEAADEAGYLLGLDLADPIVRVSVGDYALGQKDSCKLAIGAGHILDPFKLHPVYQPDGSNCLTESIRGGYGFHGHKDWYTFSAETDGAFGSDMVGNVRNPKHQELLFVKDTWNLVWDESYHPSVLSAPRLFEGVFNSLRSGGVFIFTLPVEHVGKFWITGHHVEKAAETGEFSEKLAYQNLSEKFASLEDVEKFIALNLTKIGFSKIELRESPLVRALRETGISFSDDTPEADLEKARHRATEIATNIDLNQALRYDSIFADVGLGLYCVIVTK
ncbi:MAG: hypothetical protein WCN27_00360 [Alphaproteobacteria bacterium]